MPPYSRIHGRAEHVAGRTSGPGRCRRRRGCGSGPSRRRGTMSPCRRGYPLAMRTSGAGPTTSGAACSPRPAPRSSTAPRIPATAIALRSFTPLAIAGIACTIALPFVVAAALGGLDRSAATPHPASRRARPAGGPGRPRRARVHRRGQHRGLAERLDGHRVRGSALRGRRGAARDPDPRRAHPARDRRGLRARPRRDVAPGRGRPDTRDAGRCRDGRRGGGHVRAVHGPRPSVERPVRARRHAHHHRQPHRSRPHPAGRRVPPVARHGSSRRTRIRPRSSPCCRSRSAPARPRTCC